LSTLSARASPTPWRRVGLPAPVSPVPGIANTDNTQQVAANEAASNLICSTRYSHNRSQTASRYRCACSPTEYGGIGLNKEKESELAGEPKLKPSATTLAPRQPKPSGRPTGQKLVDPRLSARQTDNVAVPREGRWNTAYRNGDEKPTAGTTSSPTSAGSSASASSAGSGQPGGTDS
jgi:hypothetical protein